MDAFEGRAERMIELVDRENGYQSARFVGQSNLLWHSADKQLMAHRLKAMRGTIAGAIREAVAAERERAKPQWSAESPTVPGYYWWRGPDRRPMVVEVYRNGEGLCVCHGDGFATMDRLTREQPRAEWCGPLEVPA